MKLKRFRSPKKDLQKSLQKQQHIICIHLQSISQHHPPPIHVFSCKNQHGKVLIFIVVKDVTRPILRIFIKNLVVKSLPVESGHGQTLRLVWCNKNLENKGPLVQWNAPDDLMCLRNWGTILPWKKTPQGLDFLLGALRMYWP